MSALTAKQVIEIKTLIRLGDSMELAIKTVLNAKEVNAESYRKAYEL